MCVYDHVFTGYHKRHTYTSHIYICIFVPGTDCSVGGYGVATISRLA